MKANKDILANKIIGGILMELQNKVKMLQMIYAGALVDSLRWYTDEGLLEKVTKLKRHEQLASGKQKLEQFGISQPEDVFSKLSDLFNCAIWEISQDINVINAETKNCLLCGYSKKLKTGSPCNIYCLDPMEGMIKAIDPNIQFIVEGTLWDGDRCKIKIIK